MTRHTSPVCTWFRRRCVEARRSRKTVSDAAVVLVDAFADAEGAVAGRVVQGGAGLDLGKVADCRVHRRAVQPGLRPCWPPRWGRELSRCHPHCARAIRPAQEERGWEPTIPAARTEHLTSSQIVKT